MTCGFMNSAGTDLDSLFLINNSNGGALGFQCSNGQDLGNRFSASSKLNYAVGFQNSAGTDIGYLRGAGSTPVFTAYNATLNNLYNSGKTSCSHGSGEDSYSHKQRYMRGYLYVTGSCSGFGNVAPLGKSVFVITTQKMVTSMNIDWRFKQIQPQILHLLLAWIMPRICI